MSIEIKQVHKLSQQLVMTPQLQQAIKLLQLSRMELVDLVREEMMENPILEDGVDTAAELGKEDPESKQEAELSGETELPASAQNEKLDATAEVTGAESTSESAAVNEIDWENYIESYSSTPSTPSYKPANDELPSLESTLTRKTSLEDHLVWQLRMSNLPPDEESVGMLIIGNLDNDGYLKEPPLADIADEAQVPIETADRVLAKIQNFDPLGVGARNLSECLLIQARQIGADDEILVKMITEHLSNLEKKNYQAIARDLKEPVEEIYEAAKVIMTLNPKPGREYSTEEPHYITPDVYVHKVGEKFFVVPNDDGLPKLKISGFYKTALGGSGKAKEYIQDKLRSAQWLIRSIQQRQRTIVKVTESIIKFQREFFEKGIAHLKPLILREVAEDINMHESTISRVTTNKYVHTPQGIFELKFFFNSGIRLTTDDDKLASEAVKTKIKQLIATEDPRHPFSDQKIVELLRDQTIDIARRTVAKYREQLGILSSSKRKQLF
jgi:RNA polymerase sigma-54 factor